MPKPNLKDERVVNALLAATERVCAKEARQRFAELTYVVSVQHGQVIVTKHGRDTVAIIHIDDLRRLKRLELLEKSVTMAAKGSVSISDLLK